jgi:hypothetical protein
MVFCLSWGCVLSFFFFFLLLLLLSLPLGELVMMIMIMRETLFLLGAYLAFRAAHGTHDARQHQHEHQPAPAACRAYRAIFDAGPRDYACLRCF